MIAIIDYDVGNITAVANMLQRVGARSVVTNDPSVVAEASRIILPGNGSFDACIRNLRSTGLIPLIERRVIGEKVPLLGICVGAQMLGLRSQEGSELGLGWLNMTVNRFPEVIGFPVPHMGWCEVSYAQQGHPLTAELDDEARFYFVHSYYMVPADPADVLLRARYGQEFVAAVARDNLVGVQFHPEKSHRFGKQLLAAFAGGQDA